MNKRLHYLKYLYWHFTTQTPFLFKDSEAEEEESVKRACLR